MSKHIYDTNEKVKEYLNEHPLERGFYRNQKGTVRFLHSLTRFGGDIAVVYATERSALSALRLHKNMSVQGINVTSNPVFDWFVNSEYLGMYDDFMKFKAGE